MTTDSTPTSQKDNIPLAVGVIILTVLALSFGDALIKLTSGNFVIWQIFVIRSLIVIPFLVLYLLVRARASFRLPHAPGWTTLRSCLLVGMWLSYYFALPHLSLSNAAAAYYTLPIFITLFSAAFVGDKISALGWFAVLLGFAGVLLILRPSTDGFNWFALLPLVSAVLYALAMILTRTHCRSEHPIVLSLALNVAFVVVGCVAALLIAAIPDESRTGFALAPWASMGGEQWLNMGTLALAILIGSVGAAIAYQNGPPAMIGTFDFAYVGFAALWGLIIFSEVPDTLSIVGMIMIVGAGILSLRQ